jgi:hypothetical protein
MRVRLLTSPSTNGAGRRSSDLILAPKILHVMRLSPICQRKRSRRRRSRFCWDPSPAAGSGTSAEWVSAAHASCVAFSVSPKQVFLNRVELEKKSAMARRVRYPETFRASHSGTARPNNTFWLTPTLLSRLDQRRRRGPRHPCSGGRASDGKRISARGRRGIHCYIKR